MSATPRGAVDIAIGCKMRACSRSQRFRMHRRAASRRTSTSCRPPPFRPLHLMASAPCTRPSLRFRPPPPPPFKCTTSPQSLRHRQSVTVVGRPQTSYYDVQHCSSRPPGTGCGNAWIGGHNRSTLTNAIGYIPSPLVYPSIMFLSISYD